ncbi:MAG: HK97 gp10 family phage protein, partial [Lacrimispora sphenoides]
MSGGKFDFKEVRQLQKQIAQLDKDRDKFCEDCARYLAARLLAKVIKRTPSDSGNLRRGWTAQGSGSGAEGLKTRGAVRYVDTLKVNHFGDSYVVEIVNPVEYASYVEYGHRTANHKGWVSGQFM